MRSVNRCSGKSICCFFGIIFSCACGAHADITLPGPDNAALLYYQAFLLRPELDDDTFLHFDSVLRGARPDEKVREYLSMVETRETLRIAEAASEIPDCSWGIMRSQGIYNLMLSTVMAQWRQIAFLLEVDARTLAVDGEYRAALDRCLRVRRLARHIADEATLAYLISMPLHWRANQCIQYILSSMSPDRDTLTWLQSQISTVQGAPPSPGRALEITLEDAVRSLSEHPEILEEWRENVSEHIEDETDRQEILSLTDEELLERAKQLYNRFLSSVNRVIGGDMPYQQKHLALQELEDELRAGSPVVGILGLRVLSNVAKQYSIYVRQVANFNAVRAAIEIYIVKAETGQLPETLPSNLPEDPFSNQEFDYEVTGQAFILRCREKEIEVDELWEYEFVVVQ